MTGRRRRLVAVLVIAVLVIAADQVTKALAIDHLSRGPVHLAGPLSLTLEFNQGVAFSIGSGVGAPIVVIVVVVIVAFGVLALGERGMLGAVATGLVLGGALSNLADRLFRGRGGAVVDFVHTGFWPTFNLADSAIVCGSILLAISFLRRGGTDEHVGAPPDGERR